MKLLHDTRLLFWRKMLEALRAPVWIVIGLSTPLLYLALFMPLLKRMAGGPGFTAVSVIDVFVPGILCLMAFGAGTGAGWVVIFELDSGVLERLRVTPTSRFALLMGSVLRDVVMLLVPALIVIVVAIPFGYHADWLGIAALLALLCLVTVTTSATSSALGITLRDIGSLAAIVTGITLPLTLLSGVLLPMSLAPQWMRVIAHLNPLYYAVEASRALSAGTVGSWTVAQAFLVMTGLTAVVLWWSTRVYRTAVA
jgi:ABC-2 type transport system permease protein